MTKKRIELIKNEIGIILKIQMDLQELLEYFLNNLLKPMCIRDKIIVINDLNEDLRESYSKLLKLMIDLYMPKLKIENKK